MIMRSLNARLSHRRFAALLASSCIIFAAGCGSDDKGDDAATPPDDSDESVSGLQPDPDPVTPPPSMPPVMQPPAVVPGGPAPNGLELPEDFLDWRVVGVAMPEGSIRVIVGNDIAVTAARRGETNPWPNGSMLGHMAWDQGTNSDAPDVVVPGDFNRITLMSKDTEKYAADGGWAYGVWMGEALTPPADRNFDRACVTCHTDNVRQFDYVFTRPGQLPFANAIGLAGTAPNGLKVPTEVLDWRVIGVAQPGGTSPTIRVIVGNDTAVNAARAGKTNPWPENSAISHYVWLLGDNPNEPGVVVPGDFSALTFMVRNEEAFEDDGGWAFSVWASRDLTAPTAPDFDRVCVDCHEARVPDNDRVFTRPGVLPER
jgi:hypothetical protein